MAPMTIDGAARRRVLAMSRLAAESEAKAAAPAHQLRHKYVPRKGRWDEIKLWQLGYKQELRRSFTWVTNAACSYSIMSVWALVDSYSAKGLAYGGPVAVVWGWVLVSCFSMAIALCMAELVSAFPTSGGLYYWSYMLAPVRYRRLACWMTGWLNLLGQVAFTACLEVALTHYIAAHVRLYTTGRHEEPGYDMTTQELLGVFTALHVVHAVLNSLSQGATRVMVVFSGWWNTVATLGFCAMLLCVAPKHQSPAFVFTKWVPGSEASGITSAPYIFMMGVLMSQWCLLGYDSCIHMCEEVVDASSSACWSLVGSVAAACLMGLITLLSLTFSLQSLDNLFDLDSASGGNGVAQLTWDVFKARYGTGHGALLPLCLPSVALFCCAYTSMTANGRMVYAFSRDGAMLGSRWWRQLSPRTQQPVAGVWLMATLSFCSGLPAVLLPEMAAAVAAVSVLALTLSYALPLGFRAGQGSDAFIPGPGISLGRWGRPLAAVCCVYITFVCAVFCMPFAYPITLRNANWSAAAILLLLAFALTLWWAPGFGGVHWFTGPMPNVQRALPDPDTAATKGGSTRAAAPAPHVPSVSWPACSSPPPPTSCYSPERHARPRSSLAAAVRGLGEAQAGLSQVVRACGQNSEQGPIQLYTEESGDTRQQRRNSLPTLLPRRPPGTTQPIAPHRSTRLPGPAATTSASSCVGMQGCLAGARQGRGNSLNSLFSVEVSQPGLVTRQQSLTQPLPALGPPLSLRLCKATRSSAHHQHSAAWQCLDQGSQGGTQLQTHISHSSPHLPVYQDSQHTSFLEQRKSRLSFKMQPSQSLSRSPWSQTAPLSTHKSTLAGLRQALSTWLGSQASEALHAPPSPSSCEEGDDQYSALRSLMEDPLGMRDSLVLQPSEPQPGCVGGGGQHQLGHVASSQAQRSASQRSSGPLELELSLPHSSAPDQYPLPQASRAAAQGDYTNTLFTTADSAGSSTLQPHHDLHSQAAPHQARSGAELSEPSATLPTPQLPMFWWEGNQDCQRSRTGSSQGG